MCDKIFQSNTSELSVEAVKISDSKLTSYQELSGIPQPKPDFHEFTLAGTGLLLLGIAVIIALGTGLRKYIK